MKFIWGKKELTLMIIPGANHRTVRIKLPQSSLYIVPSAIGLILFGFSVALYDSHVHFKRTTSSMKQAFDGQERQLSNQLQGKNNELEKLQTNLIDISRQTEEFQAKLEEIQKLKNVIELMALPGQTSKSSAGTKAQEPSAKNNAPHVGGTDSPVSSEEAASLVTGTKQELTTLVNEMNEAFASLSDSKTKLEEAQHLQSITPTLWPIVSHRITSGFGIRIDPFTQKPSMHTGLDIDGELNDPIYAAAEGKVILSEWDAEHGNHILIDHTHGLKTEYLHLNKMLVRSGDKVRKGQLIGLVGTTGRSTGTHLHYEVHVNDVPVNPTPYLLTDRKDEP